MQRENKINNNPHKKEAKCMKNPKAEQNTFTINTDVNTTIDGE